jgi:ADP-ribose pyrophosphatase
MTAHKPNHHPLHHQPWQVLAEENVLNAAPWVSVTRQHVRLPNGVEIPDFYRVAMPVYVVIFAVTSDHQVALVELYRHGPQMVVMELPAGNIEGELSLENALASAQRELREETGLTAPRWDFLGEFYVDSNRESGGLYAFLAQDAILEVQPDPEATEIMELHLIPLTELRAMWVSGRINNIASSAIVGLAFAKLGV